MATSTPPPPPPPPPPQQTPNLDEYSPSATIIPFEHPIPLLRGPILADPSDDPTSDPYLLAFKDLRSWSNAYKTCTKQLTLQCESGARIGCSIAASDKCSTPWWKTILGLSKKDLIERAQCEEQEMQACVAAAQERCHEFAKQKCLPAFKEARIQGVNNGATNRRDAARLISWVSLDRKIAGVEELFGPEVGNCCAELKAHIGVSYCRGRDLFKDQSFNQ